MRILVRNACSFPKIDPLFRPILDEAVAACLASLASQNIREIRLMGSVPRGEAREGASDIDFAVICHAEPSPGERTLLASAAEELTEQFPQVRKVDLEIEVWGTIHRARDFVLRTDSLCLYGEDSFPEPVLEIDPREIARNNTPDLGVLLDRYGRGLDGACGQAEVHQYSRWIGKDILKALRYRLLVERSVYERSPRHIADRLKEHFPDDSPVVDSLLQAYLEPHSEPRVLRELLGRVAAMKDPYLPRATALPGSPTRP